MNLRRFSQVCLSAVVALYSVIAVPAIAQEANARVSGIVTDPSKAVITGANVVAVNIDTNVRFPTKTNGGGIYVLPGLPIGDYRVEVEHIGFKSIVEPGVVLHTQDALELNFEMALGSASETVTVNAGASNDNPAVSLTVTRDFIEDMPLNGRSLEDLIALSPGAAPAGQGLYSINGQRYDANNFVVDGASANLGGAVNFVDGSPAGLTGSIPARTALGTTQSLVPLDALQEFTIQTSGYTAESGRFPGGQVTLATRSGTDTVHGSLFEYLRNTVFDANSWVNDDQTPALPKGAERQNDFGGTIGGPVAIPRLYDGKGKTFYFASYEALRLLIPSSYLASGLPSAAFRAWASPNVQPFLNTLPDPTKVPGYAPTDDGCTIPDPDTGASTACDGTWISSYSAPNTLGALSLRLDHALGKRWNLFARYADTPSHESSGTYNIYAVQTTSHSWTAGLSGNLTGSLLSETRFNFSREGDAYSFSLVPYAGSIPLERSLTIPAQFASQPHAGTYFETFPAGSSIFASAQDDNGGSLQHQYQLVQGMTWTHGSHTLKFGADWRRLLTSNIPVASDYLSQVIITSLADIQQGYASTLEISVQPTGYPLFDNLSLYAQDHWAPRPRLTLDYGLRWEFNPSPGVSRGIPPLALSQTDNLATTQIEPFGTLLYHTQYTKFAPRFGFAYRFDNSARHSVVLRAGAGLYYDTAQQMSAAAFSSGYPFQVSAPTQTEVPLPLSQTALAAPTVSLTPPYGPVYNFTDPHITLPYTEQWNLAIDRTMGAHNVMTVSYVGNVGRKLLYTGTVLNASAINPIFTAGTENITQNGAQSSYNGLQIMDNGYVGRNLQIVGSYTYSHALDNTSYDSSNYVLDYGNSDYDLRHVFNVAMNYHLPLGQGGFIHSLASGWLLATRFSAQTGTPFNITEATVTTPGNGYAQYWPDLVPGVPIYLHGAASNLNGGPVPGSWRLNRAAFACTNGTNSDGSCSSNTPTRQGTLGRNYIRTPGFYNLNFSAQRSFPIYERLNLNFRVDAFNILNHPNLGNPLTYTLADSQFGLLQGVQTIGTANALYATGAARSLQLNLHLQF